MSFSRVELTARAAGGSGWLLPSSARSARLTFELADLHQISTLSLQPLEAARR